MTRHDARVSNSHMQPHVFVGPLLCVVRRSLLLLGRPGALTAQLSHFACIHTPTDALCALLCVTEASWSVAHVVSLFAGSGKTSLLRDVARFLADVLLLSVVVVDTSGEIGGAARACHTHT
jgi:hypothetical protein